MSLPALPTAVDCLKSGSPRLLLRRGGFPSMRILKAMKPLLHIGGGQGLLAKCSNCEDHLVEHLSVTTHRLSALAGRLFSINEGDAELSKWVLLSSPVQWSVSIIGNSMSSSLDVSSRLCTITETKIPPSFFRHWINPCSRWRIAWAILNSVMAIASYSSGVLPQPFVQSWPFTTRAVSIIATSFL
jgi:hypothetical protein